MADFYITQGNLLPVLTVSAKDGAGAAVTLSNVQSVQFHMWAQYPGGATLKINAAGSYAADPGDGTARLSYTWASGDTDTPGEYWATFTVTYTNGKTQTFPTPGHLDIQVAATE